MPKPHIHKQIASFSFKRNFFRWQVNIGIGLAIVAIACAVRLFIAIAEVKKPLYFATTNNGRLIEIQSEDLM